MCARSGRGGGPDGDVHPLQIDGSGGGSSGSGGSASSAATGSVCSRRPSISAPINSRRLTPTVSSTLADRGAEAGADDDMLAEGGAGQSGSAYPVKAEGEEDRAGAGKGPATADAESNTVNSGKKKNPSILFHPSTISNGLLPINETNTTNTTRRKASPSEITITHTRSRKITRNNQREIDRPTTRKIFLKKIKWLDQFRSFQIYRSHQSNGDEDGHWHASWSECQRVREMPDSKSETLHESS